jgi:hypothetical protein
MPRQRINTTDFLTSDPEIAFTVPSAKSPGRALINLNGQNDTVFRNLTFRNKRAVPTEIFASDFIFATSSTGEHNGIIIDNCKVNGYVDGLLLAAGGQFRNLKVTNNTVWNAATSGVWLGNYDGTTSFRDCLIEDNLFVNYGAFSGNTGITVGDTTLLISMTVGSITNGDTITIGGVVFTAAAAEDLSTASFLKDGGSAVNTTSSLVRNINRAKISVENLANITIGDVLDFNNMAGVLSLTVVNVPRTPGSDDFQKLGTAALTIADLVAAINDPANSFAGYGITATTDGVKTAYIGGAVDFSYCNIDVETNVTNDGCFFRTPPNYSGAGRAMRDSANVVYVSNISAGIGTLSSTALTVANCIRLANNGGVLTNRSKGNVIRHNRVTSFETDFVGTGEDIIEGNTFTNVKSWGIRAHIRDNTIGGNLAVNGTGTQVTHNTIAGGLRVGTIEALRADWISNNGTRSGIHGNNLTDSGVGAGLDIRETATYTIVMGNNAADCDISVEVSDAGGGLYNGAKHLVLMGNITSTITANTSRQATPQFVVVPASGGPPQLNTQVVGNFPRTVLGNVADTIWSTAPTGATAEGAGYNIL